MPVKGGRTEMKMVRCMMAALASSIVVQAARSADAPVAADSFVLQELKTIKFYPDMGGVPASRYQRRPPEQFDFAGAQLLAFDAENRLYRFKFGDGEIAWLAPSSFVPLSPDNIICRGTGGRIGSEPEGGSSNRKTAGNLGLGEEICPW